MTDRRSEGFGFDEITVLSFNICFHIRNRAETGLTHGFPEHPHFGSTPEIQLNSVN